MKDAFFETETPAGFGFAGSRLDRASERREDAAFLAALRARPDAAVALIARDMPILARDSHAAFFPLSVAESLGPAEVEILLGVDPSGAPRFAWLLPDSAMEQRADASDGFLDRRELYVPGRDELELIDLRTIAVQGLGAPAEIADLGQAKAIAHWHRRHGFCANCGARTVLDDAGYRRVCPACKAEHFPRTDPCVIMLVTAGDRCLLGRNKRFAGGHYSTLAGFVEPGESIEEAVKREVFEEVKVRVGAVRYFACQPWPFPSNLMIGCFAEAESGDIVVDGEEIVTARWFDRATVKRLLSGESDEIGLPRRDAIAFRLIENWALNS